MTALMNAYTSAIVPMARMTVGYGKAVCSSIPDDKFGRRPEGVDCNTPAWVIGHVGHYPEHVLDLIGRSELARHDERWKELFANGTPAPDDADGSYYPSKDELLSRYLERSEVAIEAIAQADESVLLAINPMEGRFREMFPTIGAAAGFLLTSHSMMHLGQVSTWRRCMGLGSAM
ncbi:MAG: DinB family protein [Phycisphaerales bacterium]